MIKGRTIISKNFFYFTASFIFGLNQKETIVHSINRKQFEDFYNYNLGSEWKCKVLSICMIYITLDFDENESII